MLHAVFLLYNYYILIYRYFFFYRNRDGTTDVTRTLHFGTPTDYQKECFTRVFKGQANLAMSKFPHKVLVK